MAVQLKGSVSGIVGEVDLDYAYQDYPAIIKAAGLNGFAKMQPPQISRMRTRKRH